MNNTVKRLRKEHPGKPFGWYGKEAGRLYREKKAAEDKQDKAKEAKQAKAAKAKIDRAMKKKIDAEADKEAAQEVKAMKSKMKKKK